MNRKTLIICLSALAVLVAAIAVAITALYRDDSKSNRTQPRQVEAKDCNPMLSAVPSDAVMVLACSDASEAFDLLSDSTKVWSALFTDGGKRGFSTMVAKANGLMKRSPAVVSIHYSGELTPLLIVKAPADTTYDMAVLMDIADSLGMKHRIVGGAGTHLLEVSWSETLISSSERHLGDGLSVMDKGSFIEAAAIAGNSDAAFISHEYAKRIFASNFRRPYYDSHEFFSDLAEWSVWKIKGDATTGYPACKDGSPEYYATFLSGLPDAESKLFAQLPSATIMAVSFPIADMESYLSGYRTWLDATAELGKWEAKDRQLKDSTGLTPSKWAARMNFSEAGKATIRTPKGLTPVIALRPGKGAPVSSQGVQPWPWKGFAGQVFGRLFSTTDESTYIYKDGWIFIGSADAAACIAEGFPYSIADFCADNDIVLQRSGGPQCWFSPTEGRDILPAIFDKPMLAAMTRSIEGIAARPFVLSWKDGTATLTSKRIRIPQANPAAASADTTVVIPGGPFKVTNCATGKTNTLVQAPNMSLSLRDESGKSLWAIPFSGKLCGRVCEVDWYANGKIQFAFASGSKIWVLDRLGRKVDKFPVDLGHEIVLGPDIYDFTGAKGYSAMVLLRGNTLGLYDLHGRLRDGWKGISPESTIKDLPELLTIKGSRFWAVRTALGTEIYPFEGGEPLTKATGDKCFRTDAQLEIKDGSVSGTCFDGKVRSVKIVK